MENFVKTFCKWQWLVCMVAGMVLLSCKSSGGDTGIPKYNPNLDITLDYFYPTEGHIASQVILLGDNFGDNPDDVQVWFNEKEASIISVKGDKMLVLAPKLPGLECDISVKIGKDSVGYQNQIFYYTVQTTISTLAGGDLSANTMPDGTTTLSTAQFSHKPESSMTIDDEDNLFFIIHGDDLEHYFFMANEESDRLKRIHYQKNVVGNCQISYYPPTGDVYFSTTNGTDNGYSYFDSTGEYVAVSAGNVTWDIVVQPGGDEGWDLFTTFRTWGHRPSDGMFYKRGNRGELACFDPTTGDGINLSPDNPVPFSGGETFGLVFDPRDDNIFYFSVSNRHCIYKYDLTTKSCEVFAGQENGSGHVDGETIIARFNEPCQICIDSENIMHVADKNNHCIRSISLETLYVSTAAGIAGQAGYVNGTVENAQFNSPVGIVVTSDDIMYIGDSENKAIRRLAIE